jgi:glycosyltransferase involved in cell wall biosynthesis
MKPSALLCERGVLMVMHSLSQGGADRVAVLLANGFARSGIPTRIALMRDAADGQPEIRAMLDPSVDVVSAGRPLGLRMSSSHSPLGHRHLERVRGVRFLRTQIEGFAPAIVFAPTDNMGLITALSRRRSHDEPRFVMKLTNALLRPGNGALKAAYRRKLFGFIFQRLDLVLTLSDAEQRQLSGFFPERSGIFRTVANPYISEEMLAERREARASTHIHLVSAGRMVAQKRFDLLLEAFARLARDDARLTILGDGPLRPQLEMLARSLGVADRVDMPGYTGDLLSRLRRSDRLVLSSDYEGLPAVVLEALSNGLPVVTTDSFLAAHELLDGLTGCDVVPIRDPTALAAAIGRSLEAAPSGYDLREVAKPYRIEAAIAAHIDVFSRLVEEKAQRNQAAAA